ncbi:MAG TPA: hypothetical protein VK335_34845 [Bryobacteraceae bacterium]|nr:hypothetical protein [Bryobacteraceae bacterium]HXR14666.1 hypothetical protein [Terriglobales bacterium]HZW95684.1 hypothetical protein [Candidatus Eremiobacteraceae bacterium]
MFRHCIQLLLFAFLVTCTLRAAEDPFVGDWKLNPSKSNLTDQMKVESVGGNKYLVDVGRGPETTVVDGPDQPRDDGSTVSATAQGPNAWKIVQKKDGRVLLIANWKLSKDGNTLTDNFNAISPNGSTSTVDYVFQRKGGGSGFAGTWVSTSVDVNFVLVMQIRPYEGNGLSISSEGSTRNVKFDGKDYRRLDEHTLELTDKGSDGKIADTQEIQLSSDLKTLTMTTHIPGRSDPQILVFERH